MYTNQTGKFPVVSSQGNWYLMVLCKTDGNLILIKPMKNRISGETCQAYEKLMNSLHSCGIKVKKHIFDNEALEEYLQAITTWHQIPKDTTKHALVEHSIKSHQYVQKPFQVNTGRSGQDFPNTLVGQTSTTNREHPNTFCNQQTLLQQYWLMPTCMDSMTTTNCC